MIASLGGAEVSKTGARNYPGSGGMVGGLSMPGGNWAYWNGAGKAYNRFTPDSSNIIPSPADQPDGGGGNSPAPIPTSTGTSGGGTSPIPLGTSMLPTWVSGTYTAYTNGIPTTLTFGAGGNVTYSQGNQVLQGSLYQTGNQWFLNIGGYISEVVRTIFGFTTTDSATSSSYYGYAPAQEPVINCVQDCDSPTEIPIETGGGVLNAVQALLGGASPRTNVAATPPLYAFNPPSASGGSGMNSRMLIMLAIAGLMGWWLYKKYA